MISGHQLVHVMNMLFVQIPSLLNAKYLFVANQEMHYCKQGKLKILPNLKCIQGVL